jgi:hypothetical protein
MTTRPAHARRLIVAAVAALACACSLALAPAANADTVASSNWSGYVSHRSGVSFRSVSASWRVPAVSCQSARPGYSATWVGIGGYAKGSRAVEQAGTESDCNAAGHARYYAWYELVPAASRRVSLRVRPGDLVRGRVDVVAHRVTVTLDNASERHALQHSQRASSVDTTSADWIVETPSRCTAPNRCRTLPLAHFHRASFSSAHAVSSTGHGGAIAGSRWQATRIVLTPTARRSISGRGSSAVGGAAPSALRRSATAFSVSYGSGAQAQRRHSGTRATRIAGASRISAGSARKR